MREENFRIGNLVQGKRGIARIKQLSSDPIDNYRIMAWYIDQPAYGNSGEHLEPIPLTEEWLLKFGAVKTKSDAVNTHWRLHDRIIIQSDNWFLDYVSRIRLETVHQFQNFFFALRNEELVYNQ